MRSTPSFGAAIVTLLVALGGCAGGRPDVTRNASSSSSKDADVASSATSGDAGADSGTNEQPFAASAADATSLISAAVDTKSSEIGLCVREFRARKNLARERVTVSFGIDMEGQLLGVTSKGKEDAQLKSCVRKALERAQFPRSHAGVITVTKTYGELLQ